jgi:hypothetical protein
LHLPGFCWLDNRKCGQFVTQWLDYLAQVRARDPTALATAGPSTLAFAPLVLVLKEGESVPFVDTSVYSKNRSFRMLYSAKLANPDFPFVISPANPAGSWFTALPPPQQLLATLIAAPAGAPRYLCCCGIALHRYDFQCRFSLPSITPSLDPATGLPALAVNVLPYETICNGLNCSGVPALDAFICRDFVLRYGGPAPWIRSVSITYDPAKRPFLFRLCYRVDGNQFCARIGRQHKSNKIALTCLLGARTTIWWQTCFDPDCRQKRFRSDTHQIPSAVFRPAFQFLEQQALDQEASNYLPDALFLALDSPPPPLPTSPPPPLPTSPPPPLPTSLSTDAGTDLV